MIDDATRPRLPGRPEEETTPVGRVGQQTLVQIHDHLRSELAQILEAFTAVADGALDPAAARSLVDRMTMRASYWSIGAFCATYCRVVSVHHAIEDAHLFPEVRAAAGGLGPVLDRLSEEHEIIAAALDGVDRALVLLVTDATHIDEVRATADRFAAALLSHLDYEEEQLLGPIGRLSIQV